MARKTLLCVVVLMFGMTSAAGSFTPDGSDFAVNTHTTTVQKFASVDMNASGDFVVVWTSYQQDGSSFGVFGQRFTSGGAPAGSEFQVNTYTTTSQYRPDVAMDADGNFTVVWESLSPDGFLRGIYAQRFNDAGGKVDGEFLVNTGTTGTPITPQVAMKADGDFVVVWVRPVAQSFIGLDIFGQRFASDSTPQGEEFHVNTHTTDDQKWVAVDMDASGGFTVVWESRDQDGSSSGIFGQRFDPAGTPQGTEFQVNSYTTGGQLRPSVGVDAAGNAVVVWASANQDGSSTGIFGQRFNESGDRVGPEFRANTYTNSAQSTPSVAMDLAGNFFVAWESLFQGSDDVYGVRGQHFNSDGLAVGAELHLNTYTAGDQNDVDVTLGGAGQAAAVWSDSFQDNSDLGVFGQTCSCAPLPGSVPGFQLDVIDGGANLLLTWTDTAAAGYMVFEDVVPYGPFGTPVGAAGSGMSGLTVPMTPGTSYYLVSGHNACGMGP